MGDWGKRIKLVFDKDIYIADSAELITKLRLKEDNYGTYIYPSSVTIGDVPNALHINFEDFNQAQIPVTLEYLGGSSLRGKDSQVDTFSLAADISWQNLNRNGDCEYVEITSINISGEVTIAFDGKLYHNEYLNLSAIAVSGVCVQLIHNNINANEYLNLSAIAVSGVRADINGVPV